MNVHKAQPNLIRHRVSWLAQSTQTSLSLEVRIAEADTKCSSAVKVETW